VQARTAELTMANRELEAFSYSVAHDLRAPLRGMSGFAGIVLDQHSEKLDREAIEHLRRIRAEAELMAELIDALLGLARVTRTPLQVEPVDLSTLARATLSALAREEPERETDIRIEHGLVTRLDPVLAGTLLENLLGNAWKFTAGARPARIEVGATKIDGSRVFFVRDNGAGFDMAHAHRLFAPFHRLHTRREFPGTGIGLATAHRIVSRHGGRLWGEGKVGEGATFYFDLEGGTDR
jgi:light-regulated signal transduction histidine kinase (bacteriophytochrome)